MLTLHGALTKNDPRGHRFTLWGRLGKISFSGVEDTPNPEKKFIMMMTSRNFLKETFHCQTICTNTYSYFNKSKKHKDLLGGRYCWFYGEIKYSAKSNKQEDKSTI